MATRPLGPEDRERILALLHETEVAERGESVSVLADVVDLLTTPGLDLARRARIQVDGERATGFVALHPAPQPGELRAQLLLAPAAHSDAPVLLGLVDGWSLEDRPGRRPVTTTLLEPPDFVARDALVEGGWEVVHSYTRLSAPLDADVTGALPEGVTIRPARSEEELAAVHAVLEDAVAGHWKHQRRTFADFLRDQQSRSGHDPGLWLLAEHLGEPAGAAIARDPTDRAWIAWLGVRAGFRRQGIGDALLHDVFDRLRRRGHRRVGVDVDTHNQTGAVAVYERAGMTVVGRADQWSKTYP